MDSKIVLDPISDALGLVKANFFSIYKKMVILEIVAMSMVIIACVIGIVPFLLVFISFNSVLTNWMAVAGIILFAIIGILVGAFSSSVVESVTYNVAEDSFNKKETVMLDKVKENAWPVIKYNILMFLISFVLMLPFVVIYFVLALGSFSITGSTSIISTLLELLFRGAVAVISAILHLFLQFTIFEVVIGKNGVINSFKKSYEMVRKNLIETFVFSLLVWGIGTVIKLPLIIIAIVIGIIFVIIGALLASVLQGIALALVISILVIVGLVLIVAITAAVDTVVIPCQYQYWKRISKG